MTGQNLDELTSTDADAAALTAEQARDLTDHLKAGLSQAWKYVRVAYQGRAWLALGYRTWDQYIQSEFGHLNMQPPREERGTVVMSLREAGLSIRAISTATTLGYGTVSRTLQTLRESPAGDPNGSPADGSSAGESLGATETEDGPPRVFEEPSKVQGQDGKQHTSTPPPRPHETVPDGAGTAEELPGQVSIADELGEDAGDTASGSVLEMSATDAGIELLDLEANERGHREQARRDLREFHESGSAALPMTIKLAARVGGLLAPVVGDSPLTTEEQAGVVTDSARAVRVLSDLLGRTASRPESLGDDPAGAEQVISNLTDAVEDLNRALDGWRTKR